MNKNLTYRNLEEFNLSDTSLPKNYTNISDIVEIYKEQENSLAFINERALIIVGTENILITEMSEAQATKAVCMTKVIAGSSLKEILLVYKNHSNSDVNYSDLCITSTNTSLTLSFKKLTTAKVSYKHLMQLLK